MCFFEKLSNNIKNAAFSLQHRMTDAEQKTTNGWSREVATLKLDYLGNYDDILRVEKLLNTHLEL